MDVTCEKKFRSLSCLENIPKDLYISTTTLTCNLPITFNAVNIYKYMSLIPFNIVTIQFGNDREHLRTIIPIKKKKNITKKKGKPTKKRNFFNQVTIIIQLTEEKFINIKLFKNGSLQLTGCRDINHFLSALEILTKNLKIRKAVYDIKKKKIIKKPFVSDLDGTEISKIFNFKIRMINSNFYIGFKIDRERLFTIIRDMKVECSNDTCSHACVNIKYYVDKRKISIFVFESGSIIITGAKSKNEVLKTYKFIIQQIYDNYNNVVKLDNLELLLKSAEFRKILKENKN